MSDTGPDASTPLEGLVLRVLDKLHDQQQSIGHLSEMAKQQSQQSRSQGRELKRLHERLDKQDLNGSAPNLRELGKNTAPLLQLAAVAPALVSALPTPGELEFRKAVVANLPVMERFVEIAPKVIEAMDERAEWRIFWRRLRSIINPLRPMGMVAWTFFCGLLWAAGSAVYAHFTGT